ncbi:MAG: lipid A-modifier LpxR family protein [Pseudomonadota bacterium]
MKSMMFGATVAVGVQVLSGAALADVGRDGFKWLSENRDIMAEGAIWNDRIGDGEDRYKTGGMTQSWVFPETLFLEDRLIPGRVSALELQGRGFIATPDNTRAGGSVNDRPFVQYVGVGAYLRTWGPPERLDADTTGALETRAGIEVGWQGEPLPLFEIQEALHDNTQVTLSPTNTVDGEFLVNLELEGVYRRQTSNRFVDLDIAPFVRVSAGMRENSIRAGMDVIVGSSLGARTWNREPAIGALIPGGSQERNGFHWALWIGGDVGYIASDVFLDGGFTADGPDVGREELTMRLRAGIMMEYDPFAIVYSINWLSPEFDLQPEGQMIGAISLKYRF